MEYYSKKKRVRRKNLKRYRYWVKTFVEFELSGTVMAKDYDEVFRVIKARLVAFDILHRIILAKED